MTTYDHDQFTDWDFLMDLTFDNGSNYQACKNLYPVRIRKCSAPCVLHRHSRAVKVASKDKRCEYIIVLFARAKKFTTHILNNKADEELFRDIQLQSGRTNPLTLRKYFAIRWDAQHTLLEKLVILRHNIITLLGNKKYTGPKYLTPSNLEVLKAMHDLLCPSKRFSGNFQEKKELNSLVIFFVLELYRHIHNTTWVRCSCIRRINSVQNRSPGKSASLFGLLSCFLPNVHR